MSPPIAITILVQVCLKDSRTKGLWGIIPGIGPYSPRTTPYPAIAAPLAFDANQFPVDWWKQCDIKVRFKQENPKVANSKSYAR
jgi:hypothetical protein